MAETELYIAGRDRSITIKGSPSEVQAALTRGGDAMIALENRGGDIVIVNPAHVSHLEGAQGGMGYASFSS